MKKFLKLTFAMMALTGAMASCSSDEPEGGVTPDPVGPGIEAPVFTGIDNSAASALADGSKSVTMHKSASYTRTFFPAGNIYLWHDSKDEFPEELCVRGGRIYEPFAEYGREYYAAKGGQEMAKSFVFLNTRWMLSYATPEQTPEMMCASTFDFKALPTVSWDGVTVSVAELNDTSFAFSAPTDSKDVVAFTVYDITPGISADFVAVETPEQGVRAMYDRCAAHYTGAELALIQEAGRDLGIK